MGGSGGELLSGGTQYSCDESDENEFSEEALMQKKNQINDTKRTSTYCAAVYCTLLTCSSMKDVTEGSGGGGGVNRINKMPTGQAKQPPPHPLAQCLKLPLLLKTAVYMHVL